jgi:N utilization substance protein A
MARTLDMKFIRYLNLFEKVTKIRVQHCFLYNNGIVFVVPQEKMARALGEAGKNIKKLSEILEKKVKVISIPNGIEDIEKFVLAIIYPVKFKGIEVKEDCVVITAGMQSKAALIGRNKSRFNEMKNILNEYFGIKELRIA